MSVTNLDDKATVYVRVTCLLVCVHNLDTHMKTLPGEYRFNSSKYTKLHTHLGVNIL